MTMNYHMESSHVAEYDLYKLPGVDFTLRGPQWPLEAETPSISFLGAAQTFGAFCKYPFPNLVGEMCSARVLNFGRGGAGPGFYSKQQAVLDYVNSTDCCVVQLMSARSSVENKYMTSVEGLTRVHIKAGSYEGQEMLGHVAYQKLAEELPREEFFDLVQETRETFIEQFEELAKLITVPKILIYVGKNPPLKDFDRDDNWSNNDLIGIHPHMISENMVQRIGAFFDHTIEVHGAAGFNQKMVNRFTGDYVSIKRSETYTVTRHNAYISPYMHVKAAIQLYGAVNNAII